MASACVNCTIPSNLPSDPLPVDFEFCLDDPVDMLSADQLFSNGKLLPLQFSSSIPHHYPVFSIPRSQWDNQKLSVMNDHLFSPRCSSRWRELLRLKRFNNHDASTAKAVASPCNPTSSVIGSRSLNHFPLLNLPLLKHSDSSITISLRLSLSSSSQTLNHKDLPRLSLDFDETRPPRMRSLRPRSDSLLPYLDNSRNPIINGHGRNGNPLVAASNRMSSMAVPGTVIQPDAAAAAANRGVSDDSPRMNSSSRVVFQSLERSSNSPSSFNRGGQRLKHGGVERSYSTGVRIASILNVPLCILRGSSGVSKSRSSVFGLGQMFISSPQKENGPGSRNLGRGQRSNNVKSSKKDERAFDSFVIKA